MYASIVVCLGATGKEGEPPLEPPSYTALPAGKHSLKFAKHTSVLKPTFLGAMYISTAFGSFRLLPTATLGSLN